MSQTKSTTCYIEEYESGPGKMSARLREKVTGRKLDLGITLEGKAGFLRFLSSAGLNKLMMPDVFSKDRHEDCIVVSSDVDCDAPDEIRFIYSFV